MPSIVDTATVAVETLYELVEHMSLQDAYHMATKAVYFTKKKVTRLRAQLPCALVCTPAGSRPFGVDHELRNFAFGSARNRASCCSTLRLKGATK